MCTTRKSWAESLSPAPRWYTALCIVIIIDWYALSEFILVSSVSLIFASKSIRKSVWLVGYTKNGNGLGQRPAFDDVNVV